METFTVPGKVFLIGEYSVLQGGTALIAALRPGYKYQAEVSPQNSSETDSNGIHPESPLGRYLLETENQIHLQKLPESMSPGFGTSTAELIAGVQADLGRLPETKRLWAWYCDLFPKASGADLVVQMDALRTKQALFSFQNGDTRFLEKSELSKKIHLFQVAESKKLPTHEALKIELPEFDVSDLNSYVKQVEEAFAENNLQKLSAFNEFADYFKELGIETSEAFQIRKKFAELPDVVAVKGCGAGLHDVFIVAGEFSKDHPVYELAREFNLKSLGSLAECLW